MRSEQTSFRFDSRRKRLLGTLTFGDLYVSPSSNGCSIPSRILEVLGRVVMVLTLTSALSVEPCG